MLRDLDTAPVDERLRETLRFLRTLTLTPGELDPRPALAAGVSRQALREAVEVAAAFTLITRVADTIGARPHSARGLTREQAIEAGGRLFERGYV